MEKEEAVFRKRIQDLASLSDRRGCILYSDFLNLNEQNISYEMIQKFSWIHGETFGGYEGAERRIAAFVPEGSGEEPVYPIACVRLTPLQEKFAETLSHRDILGALMHLGIERSMLGDILVGEKETYVFCADRMAELICRELTRIRHTSVLAANCRPEEISYTQKYETRRGSVASVRLDSVMAIAFQASRSSLIGLIEGGNVFVNGRIITTNAFALHPGDIVSVRGYGKFRFEKADGQSKKGRIWAEVSKYV